MTDGDEEQRSGREGVRERGRAREREIGGQPGTIDTRQQADGETKATRRSSEKEVGMEQAADCSEGPTKRKRTRKRTANERRSPDSERRRQRAK